MNWFGLMAGLCLAWLVSALFGSHGAGLAVLGGVVGVLLSRMHARLDELTRELATLKLAQAQPRIAPMPGTVLRPSAEPQPPEPPAPDRAVARPVQTPSPAAPPLPALPPLPEPERARSTASRTTEPDEQSLQVTSSLGASLLAWFRGGNTIVRVGVLILFIGVAFLLRYAAEHSRLPIELRLAGVALAGLALTALGLRLTPARRGYGLSLQGAGVGIVYLVLFAAYRLYGLLPVGLSFALLAAMAAITTLLALRQNALPLAALGFGGAFLAPVLTSTGQGSHVALFGYLLMLNGAIALIARHKAWKLLNLEGFVLSLGIASMWASKAYRPELFWSTEPFLIAHFLLFLFIAVQYAQRLTRDQTPASGPALALVDASLLFGVPISAFGLQAAMLRGQPMALAFSAAVLAAIYLVLGQYLWRRTGQRLLLLIEGLAALGLIFLALVTPLALDARWTSAAWALQGAGVLWIGLRQRRWWAAGLGLLLQLGAAFSYWSVNDHAATAGGAWLFFNSRFLGAVLLVAAGGFSAWLLQRWRAAAAALEPAWLLTPLLEGLMLALAVLQLWAAGLIEMLSWDQGRLDAAALICAWSAALVLGFELGRRALAWPGLRWPARALMGAALLSSALGVLNAVQDGTGVDAAWTRYSHGLGLIEVLGLLTLGLWRLLRQRRQLEIEPPATRHSIATAEHLSLAWYAMLQGGLWLYALGAHFVARHEGWTPAAAILLPTLLGLALLARMRPPRWPMELFAAGYRQGLLRPWLALLMLWVLAVNAVSDASMAPLPYLPLLNPLDLAHGLVLVYGLRLMQLEPASATPQKSLLRLAAALAFWWLNSLLVRSLHHWADTPLWLDGALSSALVQTCLSVLWTLSALGTMLWATRRAGPAQARGLWMAGAVLLGIVVLKLFLVDLSHLGSLQRIVSFLAVGALMLVIGYVSPLPPAAGEARPSSKPDPA